MAKLYTPENYQTAKPNELFELTCQQCMLNYMIKKTNIRISLSSKGRMPLFCSQKCSSEARKRIHTIPCVNCAIVFNKKNSQFIRSENHFCSNSCSATYNNKNKMHGTRRSKIEAWLENELIILYPDLDFNFNQKGVISSELDIYIPSMKIAFEVNGIFHYKPIYGQIKFKQIQNNDIYKLQACLEQEIKLYVIDISELIKFNPNGAEKYLAVIINIISEYQNNNKKPLNF